MKTKESKNPSTFKPIRWTMEQAGSEFGINPRTLTKRIKILGILPGEDSRFSTGDICKAVFGDYDKERTRKMKADADKAEATAAEKRGELIDKADFIQRDSATCAAMAQIIRASELPDDKKDAILKELTKLNQP